MIGSWLKNRQINNVKILSIVPAPMLHAHLTFGGSRAVVQTTDCTCAFLYVCLHGR